MCIFRLIKKGRKKKITATEAIIVTRTDDSSLLSMTAIILIAQYGTVDVCR